jgi:hypothetical protein
VNPYEAGLVAFAFVLTIAVLVKVTSSLSPATRKWLNKILRGPLVLHNIHLFAWSLYMTVEILRQAFFVGGYSLYGNGVNPLPVGEGVRFHGFMASHS